MALGMNIKKLRLAKGWTQVQLAEKLGITQKVLATYETDARRPAVDRLPVFAKVLETSIDQLLNSKAGATKKDTAIGIPGNRRAAKLVDAFEKLTPTEQRVILNQTEALATKRTDESK